MKRILRIILHDRFRLLAIVIISLFLGSPLIMLGNGLVNNTDSGTIEARPIVATGFDFSIENSTNEPYIITKGSCETEKKLVYTNEEGALPENRKSDEISTVTFIVFNQDGLPIPDASIALSDGAIGETDELGLISFLILDESYLAEISHPLYETLTFEFINTGEDQFFEIILNELLPEPIQIICPPEVIFTATGTCFVFDLALGEPIVLDNSPGYVVTNDAPPDGFPVGATIVIWTVVNEFGETASCDQLVTVIDEEPPTITTLSDITIDNDIDECGSSASWDPPTAGDNCTVESIVGSHAPGDFFSVGSTSVIYTATDVHGNSSYAGFTVEVIDVEPPIITLLADITIDSDIDECGSSASWDPPTAGDNCEVETLVGSHAPGDFFPTGSTSVIYTATDVYGNSSYAGFTVEVIDVEPPIITPLTDITIDSEPSECGAGASWDPPTAGDNCEVETLVGSHAPGDFFSVGSTSVIYTATDVHGNPSYAGFTVEVIDVEPPIITPLTDITIDSEPGECGAGASWDPPSASDNCEVGTLESSHAPGDFFSVGSTSVIYTATDIHGNPSYAGFTVEVIDVDGECEPFPEASIEGNVDWNSSCGSAGVSVSLINKVIPGLDHEFDMEIDQTGLFATPDFEAGTYDVYIKVEGYLTKLYSDVIFSEGVNVLAIDDLIPGDINGDNSVNIVDISAMNVAFGSSEGEDNYSTIADYNCDGFINIIDFSLIVGNFGLAGDSPPFVSTE